METEHEVKRLINEAPFHTSYPQLEREFKGVYRLEKGSLRGYASSLDSALKRLIDKGMVSLACKDLKEHKKDGTWFCSDCEIRSAEIEV